MSVFTILRMLFCLLIPLSLFQACETGKGKDKVTIIRYERFRDSVLAENRLIAPDTSNIFDDETFFTPGVDSVNTLLITIDTLLRREISLMERMDSLIIRLKNIESYSQEEKANLKENISMLNSFLTANKSKEKITCREKECYLYVEVIKSRQTLYLYLDGVLKDSFPVSTGINKYTTPNINLRPTGPLFTKYTSRKWPGGNYKGLGNMPYAVFVKGGYAIHGTTPGNFSKLGTVASHGCIRIHPDNARVFYELVNLVGISDTWVNVRDSI
jgi:hypothetical protein